ncbi:MAG: Na/Pi cotransporter family protein [Verrucomicrobiales bacterium]|nr:Na/Pi cotransporter family protein [Verrucomicrobiales bacterium]
MNSLLQTFGGVGLFLFGMAVMTSGLRKLAGDRLRTWLVRSTKNPVTGALTGATVTALIQSSSATTVAAIGFVGAGLMTFTASLGVIFGANIGTTITGWMVALLGFKLQLSEAALPLLFIASLCYLFKQVRPLRGFGKALAGFCLIFLGISYLQSGLEGYRDVVDLSRWSASAYGGRAVLLLVGIFLTLVTQSSSATVATALTALNASLLDLPQAAAVIIGADIGTTGTAALATIGGTTASRRTGFAHVIYNLMTGVGAFFFLPLYLLLVDRIWPAASGASPEVVAVGFHSVFNTLGVIVALPFTRAFGRFIERVFPERASALGGLFDKKLLEDSSVAIAGLTTGCRKLGGCVLDHVEKVLTNGDSKKVASLEEIFRTVEVGRDFAVKTGAGGEEETEQSSQLVFDCIHAIDHIERLAERAGDSHHAKSVRANEDLRSWAVKVAGLLRELSDSLESGSDSKETGGELIKVADDMENDKQRFRQGMIQSAAKSDLSGEELDTLLDAHRWMRRIAYHSARIAHYSERLVG